MTEERRYARIQEGDEVVLNAKVARANSEQAFIEFLSMEGPYSIRVPVGELKPRQEFTPEQDHAVRWSLVCSWLAGFLAGLLVCMFLVMVVL